MQRSEWGNDKKVVSLAMRDKGYLKKNKKEENKMKDKTKRNVRNRNSN